MCVGVELGLPSPRRPATPTVPYPPPSPCTHSHSRCCCCAQAVELEQYAGDIAVILAVDWFLDRCRTVVNVLASRRRKGGGGRGGREGGIGEYR